MAKELTRAELLEALENIAFTLGRYDDKADREVSVQHARDFSAQVFDGRYTGWSARGLGMGACAVITAIVDGPHCPRHLWPQGGSSGDE